MGPNPFNTISQAAAWALRLPIWAYRYLVSPVLPMSCRYYPTCSQYGLDALRMHGPLKGGWLTFKRITRCHPWAEGGIDPVPCCDHTSHSTVSSAPADAAAQGQAK